MLVDLSKLQNSTNVVQYESYDTERYIFDINLQNSVCWYDCHPFEGHGVVIPRSKTSSKWYCFGVFCSWECARAYCKRHKIDESLLLFMYKWFSGDREPIPRAHPRECLQMFGGVMDIDTFRSGNNEYIINYTESPFIHSLNQQIKVETDIQIVNNIYTEKQAVMGSKKRQKRQRHKTKHKKVEEEKESIATILFD